eukprot:2010176-Amphidinium_carterae.1
MKGSKSLKCRYSAIEQLSTRCCKASTRRQVSESHAQKLKQEACNLMSIHSAPKSAIPRHFQQVTARQGPTSTAQVVTPTQSAHYHT